MSRVTLATLETSVFRLNLAVGFSVSQLKEAEEKRNPSLYPGLFFVSQNVLAGGVRLYKVLNSDEKGVYIKAIYPDPDTPALSPRYTTKKELATFIEAYRCGVRAMQDM